MKYIVLLSLVFGLNTYGCDIKCNASEKTKLSDTYKDKEAIQTLIRHMLKWADSKNAVDLIPIFSKDSICTGINFEKQKQNVKTLRKTGFFAEEFIENYNHIMQTLDKQIKDKKYVKWNVYELPTFNFDNDANPWCSCQDNLSWDKVEVKIITLTSDKGKLTWNWGKLDPGTDSSWKVFTYTFRVVKVDNKWKISYLQGFDYKEGITMLMK